MSYRHRYEASKVDRGYLTTNELINNSQPELPLTTEQKYEHFSRAIIAAADAAIPKTKANANAINKHRPVPYWSASCAKAVKKREKALAISHRTKSINAIIEYRKQKALCRRTITEAKQVHWEKFCDGLTDSSSLSSVWRMARSMQGLGAHGSIPTLTNNTTTYRTNAEKAELFANKFSSNSARTNHTKIFIEKSATKYRENLG